MPEAEYTREQCVDMLLRSYKREALPILLATRPRTLGGLRTVDELLSSAEGRRKAHAWALGLAEGVMG